MKKLLWEKIVFKASYTKCSQLPKINGIEVAVAGRSNAGKSSVINALANQNKLCKTSSTPGKTRQLVFFEMPINQFLVDLPGYGYAKVPRPMQQEWGKELTDYIYHREQLIGMVVIMDIRHPLQKADLQMLDFVNSTDIENIIIVLNKSDKLKKGAIASTRINTERELKKLLNKKFTLSVFSAQKKVGVKELRNSFAELFEAGKQQRNLLNKDIHNAEILNEENEGLNNEF